MSHSFFIGLSDGFLTTIDFDTWVAFYFSFSIPALVAAKAANALNVYNAKYPTSFIFHVHNGLFPNFMTETLLMKSKLSNPK